LKPKASSDVMLLKRAEGGSNLVAMPRKSVLIVNGHPVTKARRSIGGRNVVSTK
jgi:hypothetical protein